MGLQTLAHFDYVKINWPKVQEDFTRVVDADGDGKLTKEDVLVYWGR